MALFRSDVLNQEFFKRAIEEAEKSRSVDILEVTVGEPKSGPHLQVIFPVYICVVDTYAF